MSIVTWNDVTVAIPTVAGREKMLGALLAQIGQHCPGAEVLVTTHVSGEPARVTFPRALATAADRMRPWVLQFEDDVHLAPTFGAEALDGLNQCDALTLFTRSKEDLAAMDRGERVRRVSPASFSMSQAFFLRRDFAAGVEAYAPGWYAAHPQHNRAADLLLAGYLSSRKARVLARVPSLVQHRRGPSTLPGHHGARQSESYRLTFGEVP
jgi:hypothetical protein